MSQTAKSYCEPAASLIERLGGAKGIAKAIRCSEAWVYRWRLDVPGGTRGEIPRKAREAILAALRDGRLRTVDGQPITSADFVIVEPIP